MRSFYGLAVRNLKARRLRVLLTTLGVVFGVGMIFGVLLLVNTLNSTFNSLYDSIYGRTDLVVSGQQGSGSLPVADLAKVRSTKGVKVAEGLIFDVFSYVKNGKSASGQSSQVNVSGIDPDAANLSSSEVKQGHRPRSGRQIELELNWAKSRDIELGEKIKLGTPAGIKDFKVVGLFEFGTGNDFGGRGFAAIPIATARKVMDKPSVLSEIDLALEDPGQITAVQKRLKRKLGRGVEVATPASKSEQIQDQLKVFSTILYFFAAMALFVGSFIIFNSFSMTVLQRIRELGMLRTLGATRAMIVRSVLLEAALLGIIGSLLGLVLGFALAVLLIELIKLIGFPIGALQPVTYAYVVAVLVGVLVTAGGALYPAVRAGRIAPVRAVLGDLSFSRKPRKRRAVLGLLALLLGLVGVYTLASSESAPTPVAVAGAGGVVFLFLGV